ncbi:MAG: hypothetical protein ACK4OO_06380, partial [bacterium]
RIERDYGRGDMRPVYEAQYEETQDGSVDNPPDNVGNGSVAPTPDRMLPLAGKAAEELKQLIETSQDPAEYGDKKIFVDFIDHHKVQFITSIYRNRKQEVAFHRPSNFYLFQEYVRFGDERPIPAHQIISEMGSSDYGEALEQANQVAESLIESKFQEIVSGSEGGKVFSVGYILFTPLIESGYRINNWIFKMEDLQYVSSILEQSIREVRLESLMRIADQVIPIKTIPEDGSEDDSEDGSHEIIIGLIVPFIAKDVDSAKLSDLMERYNIRYSVLTLQSSPIYNGQALIVQEFLIVDGVGSSGSGGEQGDVDS